MCTFNSLLVYLSIDNFYSFRDLAEFEACFSYACPKFLSPVSPNFDLKAPTVMNSHKVRQCFNHIACY